MMNFELLNRAMSEYKKTVIIQDKKEYSSDTDSGTCCSEENSPVLSSCSVERNFEAMMLEEKEDDDIVCSHENVNNEGGVILCTDCGEEISRTVFQDKEWRYYGQSDNKRTSDPNRVQIRRCEDRNIYKDVENMGFSEKIVSHANLIYADVTKGQIFRGNSRKSIVFACIFHAYKISGKPQTHDKLIGIFDLNRKNGLKGLKYVTLNAPKESKIHTTYITPVNLVDELMDKFNSTPEQKMEVNNFYHQIKNKSSKLNRSRPQSVASGLVFYWILSKNIQITVKEFARKAELSELTIIKIAKEISEILGTPEII
jgi:transcription initiation factor TFIIIB Brf1 subunit/transcription initiation factor TFIIB